MCYQYVFGCYTDHMNYQYVFGLCQDSLDILVWNLHNARWLFCGVISWNELEKPYCVFCAVHRQRVKHSFTYNSILCAVSLYSLFRNLIWLPFVTSFCPLLFSSRCWSATIIFPSFCWIQLVRNTSSKPFANSTNRPLQNGKLKQPWLQATLFAPITLSFGDSSLYSVLAKHYLVKFQSFSVCLQNICSNFS